MRLSSSSEELFHDMIAFGNGRAALDIGANTGLYAGKLLSQGWEVWAMEPVPDMFDKTVEAHGTNPKAHLFKLAISDREEVIKDVSVQSCWTLVPDGTAGLSRSIEYLGKPTFDLQCTTIDEFCRTHGENGEPLVPGFIKLDVDGYELKALRGGVKTILARRPPILCELNCYINKLGQSPEEFVKLVTETLNYRFVSMDGKVEMTTWAEIEPQWPYHSSYDVMLTPN
jgi:FkbM family methyltransferase